MAENKKVALVSCMLPYDVARYDEADVLVCAYGDRIIPSLPIIYNGETKTLSQWARKYNINTTTLSDRLKMGMAIDEALNKPVIKCGGKLLFTLNGETKLLGEWCKIYDINYYTAWKKAKRGYSIEKILKIEECD